MKRSLVLTFLLACIVLNDGIAQNETSPLTVGENIQLQSQHLAETRQISIYLPDGYNDADLKYPVLYILDGQRYFLNGMLYQKTLLWQEKTPEFIVVGINTDNRRRRTLFYEDSDAFIRFLEHELIPYIDQKYRTSDERMIFGWEMAAGLVVELLAEHEVLFNAYFMASATHVTEERLRDLSEKLNSKPLNNKFLYFTLSPLESWAMESMQNLSKVLQDHAAGSFRWQYQLLEGENHHSTPTKTFHNGLSTYFSDYPYLRFYSLREFEDFGGMDALKNHFRKRGERYNLSGDIHKDTKHFLLLQAMREGAYDSFVAFMTAFGDYYKSKTRDLWFNRYGLFYLKHQNTDKALEVLNAGLRKFEDSALLLSGLGDVYLAKGELAQAKSHYQQAVEIATKNKDHNLEQYKQKLAQF